LTDKEKRTRRRARQDLVSVTAVRRCRENSQERKEKIRGKKERPKKHSREKKNLLKTTFNAGSSEVKELTANVRKNYSMYGEEKLKRGLETGKSIAIDEGRGWKASRRVKSCEKNSSEIGKTNLGGLDKVTQWKNEEPALKRKRSREKRSSNEMN